MNEQTVRKTFKYKLMPTPSQERKLGRVLGLCRYLYNAARNIERLGQSLRGGAGVPASENRESAGL